MEILRLNRPYEITPECASKARPPLFAGSQKIDIFFGRLTLCAWVRPRLGRQALLDIFRHGVNKPLPFVQGDTGDVDGDDGNP